MNPESSNRTDNSGINEAGKDTTQTIIEGDVDVKSGDFVGRDQHIHGDVIYGDKVAGNKVTIGTLIANFFRGDSDDVRKLRNRQAMIQLVRDIWVKGVLEHSLYNQLLIDLEMEHRPEVVERPWGMVLDLPEQASRSLPSGIRMIDIFNEINQSLLILGEPGSGKSTMLLELARDLLTQAEQNLTLLIPVYFNLSTWAEKQQPIRQWLVEELWEEYHIPKTQAQGWVENDELLLLLDGLDEVKQEAREACVTALNNYQQNCKSVVPLALCSRTAEYSALTRKLKLNGAIVLRSLTEQQIDTFLMRAGDKLAGVAQLLQQDRELQALAQSPLTLSILCLTYQDKTISEIQPESGTGSRLKQLFDAYIMRMFQRPGKLLVDKYPHEKTLHWLAWLAARMVQYEQTEFLIERMQPQWLQISNLKQSTNRLIMLIWGPLYGVIFGSLYGFLYMTMFVLFLIALIVTGINQTAQLSYPNFDTLLKTITGTVYLSLILGLIIGVFASFSDWLTGGIATIHPFRRSMELWKKVRNSVSSGVYWGLWIWLHFKLLDRFSSPEDRLIIGVSCGIVGGLITGTRSIYHTKKNRTFKERVQNSQILGTTMGCLLGLTNIYLGDLYIGIPGGTVFRMINGLTYGIIGAITFEVVLGSDITPDYLTTTMTQEPNQSIRKAVKSSLIIWLLVSWFLSFIGGLVFTIGTTRSNRMMEAVIFGGIFGWLGGLIGGILGGGDIVSKHLILRLALYLKHYAPLNYARFLDYCADRIFLRKVGGGYIFVHRLLLEHFAALTEADIQRLAGTTKNRY